MPDTAVPAAVSDSDSDPRFVEFSEIQLIEGSVGNFFFIEGVDYRARQKVYLRLDEKFKDLVQDEIQALTNGEPASFFVVIDPRKNQPNHFRVDLDYYRSKCILPPVEVDSEFEAILAEAAASTSGHQTFEAVTPSPNQLKSVTATVSVDIHAKLRDLYRKQTRYSRFGDFLSAMISKTTDLFALC